MVWDELEKATQQVNRAKNAIRQRPDAAAKAGDPKKR
jgi:hypothetical protein